MDPNVICGSCLCGSVRYEATGVALQHYTLPLFGLPSEQRRTVRHVGIVPQKRIPIHCGNAE